MAHRKIISRSCLLATASVIMLFGCGRANIDPICSVHVYVNELRNYLKEHEWPNVIVARLENTGVYHRDDNSIFVVGTYEICHSFDDRFHTGDLLFRRSHFEGDEMSLHDWSSWAKGCKGQTLRFFPITERDIDYRQDEPAAPNDRSTFRSHYYVGDLVPITLSGFCSSSPGSLSRTEIQNLQNALKAYDLVKQEYRVRKPNGEEKPK